MISGRGEWSVTGGSGGERRKMKWKMRIIYYIRVPFIFCRTEKPPLTEYIVNVVRSCDVHVLTVLLTAVLLYIPSGSFHGFYTQ